MNAIILVGLGLWMAGLNIWSISRGFKQGRIVLMKNILGNLLSIFTAGVLLGQGINKSIFYGWTGTKITYYDSLNHELDQKTKKLEELLEEIKKERKKDEEPKQTNDKQI